jgi:shikimate dehydrogenase
VKHVALIGLSGSGKSTLGALAAKELGVPFVDLDSVVERSMEMPIREIFERHGEDYFRDIEARTVREITSSPTALIIATGGGVVLRSENMEALRGNCLIVFLDRPVGQIVRDISYDDSRPLAASPEKLFAMERHRRPLYLKAAHTVLQNDEEPEDALSALLPLIREWWSEPITGYAVIGDPIAHTLSPAIHGAVFSVLGIDERYSALRVSREGLRGFVEKARSSGMKGFNVTIPHKRDIIQFLDDVDEEAALCGAVNTVTVRDGRLSGFNTDMGGLLESLRGRGRDYRLNNVLILGAGGASRGVAFKAAREGASMITILARKLEKADEIADGIRRAVKFNSISTGIMSPEAMTREASSADILVNATPLGMSGVGEDFDEPLLEFLRALPGGAIVCDLIYNPPETSLLREAAALGIDTQNGLGMLIHQALLADELFLERELDKPAIYKTVKEGLTK